MKGEVCFNRTEWNRPGRRSLDKKWVEKFCMIAIRYLSPSTRRHTNEKFGVCYATLAERDGRKIFNLTGIWNRTTPDLLGNRHGIHRWNDGAQVSSSGIYKRTKKKIPTLREEYTPEKLLLRSFASIAFV